MEFWPLPDGPAGAVAFKYENGVTVHLMIPSVGDLRGGAIFAGQKGRIEIIRNGFRTDPPQMIKELPPPEEVQKWRDEVALWQAKYHMQNWLDCIKSRKQPSCGVNYHYNVSMAVTLANVAYKVGRSIRVDPQTLRIVGDEQAAKLARPVYRDPWKFPAQYL